MRYIRCLLCNIRRPFDGFLSHIRQQHLNYNRYKCTNCSFVCDTEEDSTLHRLETNHNFEFDGNNYQEHLVTKIFQDCYREQSSDQCEMEKKEIDVSGQTNKRDDGSLCSATREVSTSGTSRGRRKGSRSSDPTGHKISKQRISKSRRNSKVIVKRTRGRKKLIPVRKSEPLQTTNTVAMMVDDDACADDGGGKQEDGKQNVDKEREIEQRDENIPILVDSDSKEKPESEILKTSDDNDESHKLPETDKQSCFALNSSSNALFCPEKIKNTRTKKALKVEDDDVILINEEISEPTMNIYDEEIYTTQDFVPQNTVSQAKTVCQKCGKEVNIHYMARKAHALEFHFAGNDDPEIDELLPETIKACFPLFLSSSDYQCTECGKTFGAVGSRRSHVLKEHFYWSSICPLSGCTTVISALSDLNEHLMLEHNIQQSKIPKNLKLKLGRMENEWKNDLNRQLNHCFPCPLPQKKQSASTRCTNDGKGLPKPSISDALSSILHSQTTVKAKRKIFTYSSSDTESSSADDEDNSGIKGKKSDIKVKRESGTEGCETLDSTASKGCSVDMTLSEQQLCCTVCHLKVVKELLESHAWTHLPETVVADGRLPFQCACCEFAACRLPDVLCHAKKEHGNIGGDAFISRVSYETLEFFLRKVTECFPPLKRDS